MAKSIELKLKTAPGVDGKFTITDGTKDYEGVIPEGMEHDPDRAILSFAAGIAEEERKLAEKPEYKETKLEVDAVVFEKSNPVE